MLIDDPQIIQGDPLLDMLAAFSHNEGPSLRLQQGIYQVGHFGSSDFPRGYEQYAELPDGFGAYGVCDDYKQILAICPELESSEDRQFLITLTPVVKANQPPDGGWRWHKWGEYIGTHEIRCEYLYDEEGIEKVFVYHIYEAKPAKAAR